VREFQASAVYRTIPVALLDSAVAESLRLPARVWRNALSSLLAFDGGPALGRLGMPTLLVWGDRDTIATREDQARLLRGIRRSRLEVLAEFGHAPHWEDPGRFVDLLQRFLREEAPAARGGTPAPR
jgi:pimeloyl-ACP methyl ester carboxylesterase